jgi:hypothetical protein
MASIPQAILNPDVSAYLLAGAGLLINVLVGVIVMFIKKDSEAKERRIQDLEKIAQNEMVRVGTFVPFRAEFLESFRRMEDKISARLDVHDAEIAELQVGLGRVQGRLDAPSAASDT